MQREQSYRWTVTDGQDASKQEDAREELPDVVDPLAKNEALRRHRDSCTKAGSDKWLVFGALGNAYHTIYTENRRKNVTTDTCIESMQRFRAISKDVNIQKDSDDYKQAQQESAFAIQHMMSEAFFFGLSLAMEKFRLLPQTEEERKFAAMFVTDEFSDVPKQSSTEGETSEDSCSSLKARNGSACPTTSELRSDES